MITDNSNNQRLSFLVSRKNIASFAFSRSKALSNQPYHRIEAEQWGWGSKLRRINTMKILISIPIPDMTVEERFDVFGIGYGWGRLQRFLEIEHLNRQYQE
jgi:hypothetical protein